MSFRRSFSWLILLVALPSAGLSGFGVLAIINERAAVEKRLDAAWAGRLDMLGDELKNALRDARILRSADGITVSLPDGARLSESRFTLRNGIPIASDARLGPLLQAAVPQLPFFPDHPVAFSTSGQQGSAILMTLREGDELLGARLSLPALQRLLQTLAHGIPGSAEAQFVLRPVRAEGSGGLVDKLVSGMAQARGVLEQPVLATHVLPSPLQDFRLEAVSLGLDPVARASTRNRVVYVVLLVIFYLTLIGGVVYTGRVLYREARLSRMKTDFVSLVSHELRTPLTSIRMFIETLALGRVKDPAETQQVLALLVKETERLSQMIDRVLDWARLESGRREYSLEQTRVSELVETALAAFRAQRLGATMTLVETLEPGLPAIRVDREAMAGALLNLLQNAFKYTGVEKRIALSARRAGKRVRIDVEDNGIGITAGERKRIFDRFYRVDNLLTRKTEGSGLGLAISKRIVEAHGGRLLVKSELGKGSCFTLFLPASSKPHG